MPHDAYKALYIHVPFCVKRCAYCDFATEAVESGSPRINEYIEDMCMNIRKSSKEGELAKIETVYIGGGTPSFAGQKNLSMLLYTLSTSMHLTPEVECTMEANPESLTEEMIKDIWALGVNRLSIGVQSFDDEILNILGRAHDSKRAKQAIEAAKTRFENISIDLMCGIPGQTIEVFKQSVKEAINLNVPHISIYPLTIEERTPFYRMLQKGELELPDEDHVADQMEAAEKLLEESGYSRYEVASYAKPGFECKHNISYWTGKPYLGIGFSAATMTQNSERRMRVQNGRVMDDLNAKQMAAEDLMLGVRMSEGVSEELVSHAQELVPETLDVLEDLCNKGLLVHKGGRWKPTRKGWLLGNELYEPILFLAP